ncbi:MAG TPA: FecR domain-containing protein [Polyangiaceae bacterium]|nr:FecR domain-containing protein [Polyangiaceae bacterium]
MEPLKDYARLAAALLTRRSAADLASQLERVQVDREAGVAAVANAIAERARRRQRRRWLGIAAGFSAAASIALVAGFVGGRHGGRLERAVAAASCSASVCGASALGVGTLPSGKSFMPGEHLVAAPSGSSSVQFGPITRLTLSPAGELEFREGGPVRRFGLLRGSLQLVVEKLKPGERFLVHTPDAEVEVHGTTFEVSVSEPSAPEARAACLGSRTRVRVQEGVVRVRAGASEVSLSAGQVWPAQPCEETATPLGSAREKHADVATLSGVREASSGASARRAHHSASASASSHAGSSPGESPRALRAASDLNRQNDLYASALAARRAGDTTQALSRFERLLGEFPGGPLSESALVERMRLLKSMDTERGRVAARQYLAKFPHGFARAEAERSLGE